MDKLSDRILEVYKKDQGLWWTVAGKLGGLLSKDEVRQIILLALWEAVETYDADRNSWKAWAIRVLEGKINTTIKHHYRKKEAFAKSHWSLSTPPEGHDKPLDVADERSTEDTVINRLDAERLLVEMRDNFSELEWDTLTGWMYGYTYREIAEVYGYKAKAVDNALGRVKKKSAEFLGLTKEEAKAISTKRYIVKVATG